MLPHQVFTPRSAKVNEYSYVQRQDLEWQLVHALRGSKKLCIFGESGNGKSWLYKHVFKQHGVTHHTINLTLADAQDCLHAAFEAKADSIEGPKFEITTMTTGAFQPGGVGVGGERTKT